MQHFGGVQRRRNRHGVRTGRGGSHRPGGSIVRRSDAATSLGFSCYCMLTCLTVIQQRQETQKGSVSVLLAVYGECRD